jgi:hypothetical protein
MSIALQLGLIGVVWLALVFGVSLLLRRLPRGVARTTAQILLVLMLIALVAAVMRMIG